ncbi:MAG TPA: 50S ribosomal protein L29 [Methylocella sp.]|nr:50S ribosomal protein L29 [Methylocella sp.]
MAKNVAKTADIRLKTDKELETRLADLRKERFNLRFQKATGQMANTARVRHVRKEIAKIETVIGERKRGGGTSAPGGAKPTKSKPAKSAA